MRYPVDRRSFLNSSLALSTAFAWRDLSFFSSLPMAATGDFHGEDIVRLEPDIEPLVRLIEQTPRAELLSKIGREIQQGLSYQELLAGLQLAGVRNVEPRPSVGFQFHTVLVVNSTHLASLASPPQHRWIPLFWALDYFKVAAERDVRERGDWTMSQVDENAVPASHRAREALIAAMEDWDPIRADAAVAGMARSAGAHEIYELMFRYGARDFRSIGHKAIFVANSYRTLQCIGWRHAEPILRSLVYALLMHEGGNPRDRDAEADRPWRTNCKLAQTIRSDWRQGRQDDTAVEDLLQTLRSGTSDEAAGEVVKLLNAGIAPQSIWDAMFVAAGELILQQPGIIAIHANTTTNALAFAYRTTGDDETRRLMMLQNAAFLPLFRSQMPGRGGVRNLDIGSLMESAPDGQTELATLFDELGSHPVATAGKVLGHLRSGGSPREFLDAARLLIYRKSRDSHDYKFSSAVLEDYYNVSPNWRNAFLAANTLSLKHSGEQDSDLVERTRAALS